MAAINDEIKRLDMLKLGNKKARSRSRTVSLVSSEAKCVAKECRYTGINTNNKTAVGVCRLCGLIEHFDCSKTSAEDRDEILKGSQYYVCTMCFLKNPSQVTFHSDNLEENSDVLPKALEGPSNVMTHDCTSCPLTFKDLESLNSHNKDTHDRMLSDEVFVESESQSSNDNIDQSSGNQESSSVAEVTHFCTECNDKFDNKDSLEDHILDVHPPTCPLCSNIFVDNENLQFHMKHSHTPSCNKCDAEFQQQSDLEEHIRDHLQTVQVHKCNHCDGEFTSEDLLGDHMNTDHLPSVRQLDCPLCNDIFNSKETFRVHFVDIHKNLVHSV